MRFNKLFTIEKGSWISPTPHTSNQIARTASEGFRNLFQRLCGRAYLPGLPSLNLLLRTAHLFRKLHLRQFCHFSRSLDRVFFHVYNFPLSILSSSTASRFLFNSVPTK